MHQEPTSTQDMAHESENYTLTQKIESENFPAPPHGMSLSSTYPVDLSNKVPSPFNYMAEPRMSLLSGGAMLPAPQHLQAPPPPLQPHNQYMLPVSPPSMASDSSGSPSSQVENFADVHVCPYCNRQFKYKNNLSTHIKNKHKQDSQPSQCMHCGKHFSSRASMTFHVNKFHMPRVLTCQLCPMRFSLPVYLNAHIKTKHGRSVCNFCCEPIPVDLAHIHQDDRSCPMCNKVFYCSTFKRQHLDNTTCGAKLALLHNMLPPVPIQAPPPLSMHAPNYYQNHPVCGCADCVRPPPQPALSDPPKTPTCNICGSTFADMGTLGFHVGVVHVGMGQNYSAGY